MAIAGGQGGSFATVEMDLDNSQNLSLTNFVYANRGNFPPRLLVDYFGVNDEFLGTNSYSFGPGPRVENFLPVEPWGLGVVAGDPNGFPFFQLVTPTEPFQGVPLGKITFRSFQDTGYAGVPGVGHGTFMLDAIQLDAATTTFNPNGYARLSFDEFAAHGDGDSLQGASIPGFIDNLTLTAVGSANPIAENFNIDHGPGNGAPADCCGFRHPATEPEPIFGEHIALGTTEVNDGFGNSALEIDMDNSAALSPVSFYFAYRGNGVPDVIIEYFDVNEQSLGTETFNGSDDGGAGLGLSVEFYPEFDQIVVGSPVSSNLTVGSVVGTPLSKMLITVDNKNTINLGQSTNFSMDDLLFACTTGTCPTVGNGTPCDFNSDDNCDATDIDLLAAAVRNGTSDSKFNVDGQGDANIPDDNDFDFYITDDSMLSTGFGDGDLNMMVNFNDFVLLSNDFGMSGTGWGQGNFNTDDNTNFDDFVRLSNNFGKSFVSDANVPEPVAAMLLGVGGLALVLRRV